MHDLVTYVDAHYRTIPLAESRGITGHSMGGYASIMLGMKHPDVFSAVYAMSPCCLVMDGDLTAENKAWSKALHIKHKEELSNDPQMLDEFWVDVFVALAAAFFPDPQSAPLFVEFPYREQGGKLIRQERARSEWQQKMPTVIASQFKDNLTQLHGLWIDYGFPG